LRFLGRISRTRGNKGEVVLDPSPEMKEGDLQKGVPFRLQSRGHCHILKLVDVRHIQGEWVLAFAETRSIAEAYRLVGYELWLDTPADSESEEPVSLIGFSVFDTMGNACGVVEAVYRREVNPLLELNNHGRLVLVPWHPQIVVEIDMELRRVVIAPPEGLMDLNS